MGKDDKNLSRLYCEATGQPSDEDSKKLADFFVNLVVKLEKGDKEAQRILSLPPEQLTQELQNSQTVQTEAFENIRSKIGGVLGGATPLTRRFQMFVSQMNKRLWELEQDLQTSGSENVQRFNNLMNQLQMIDPGFKSEGGSLQKIGYGAGKVAGKIGKIAGVGLIASTLSTIGMPAAAVGGIIGAGLSFLKNADKTKMSAGEKLKKVLISAGLGGLTGYALGELRQALQGMGPPDAPQVNDTKIPSGEGYGPTISLNPTDVYHDPKVIEKAFGDWVDSKNLQSPVEWQVTNNELTATIGGEPINPIDIRTLKTKIDYFTDTDKINVLGKVKKMPREGTFMDYLIKNASKYSELPDMPSDTGSTPLVGNTSQYL